MIKKHLIAMVVVCVVLAALPVIFVVSVYRGAFGVLQSRGELLNFKNAEATLVLSAEGELIGNIFSENRTNISYDQIPAELINALIATEDSRFYDHKGIDSRSFFRVVIKSLLLNRRNAGGGSTISQQLAKNMFGRKYYGPFSMLIIKTKEAILANRLEKTYSKEEILTLYLNTVTFGEGVYGIETASRRYFNKKVEHLNIEESAVLIGMLKANTRYNPRLHPENAVGRRNVVLKQMQKYSYLNSSQADSLCKLPLVLDYSDIESGGPADYFLVRIKNEAEQILHDTESHTGKKWNLEEDGLIITSTLNLTLQGYVLEAFREHLSVMQKRLWEQYKTPSGEKAINQIVDMMIKNQNLSGRADEISMQQVFDWNGTSSRPLSVTDSLKQSLLILHAGLLAIDPYTGSVKAWVGGIDFQSQPYDQIYARRQLASVFKPILFAEAFEEGMEPCQYIDNDSIEFSGTEDWNPENADSSSGGKYSLAGALVRSMNIPTVNLFYKVDFEKLDSLWKKMGFSFTLNNSPSTALGTAEGSILETAIAYSAFVNNGYRVTPQCILSIKTPDGDILYQNELNDIRERVLSERSANLISAILQKAIREGTGSSILYKFGVDRQLAGKTGTSQNYSDAWFTAFNPKLVLVTRVGASLQSVHFNNGFNGYASALALPLAGLTLRKVMENDTLRDQFFTSFPQLPPELAGSLDCPDYKEKNMFDRIQDLFQKKKLFPDEVIRKSKPQKKKFFNRLFGR